MSQGKTVVISGATRGLGLALSREFARQGWFIYGCGRNPQRVAETQRVDTDMLRASFLAKAHAYPSPEQWAAAAYPYLVNILPNVKSSTSVTVPGGRQ